jgi:hypothetical protein
VFFDEPIVRFWGWEHDISAYGAIDLGGLMNERYRKEVRAMYHEHQSNYAFTVTEHLSAQEHRKIIEGVDNIRKRDLELIGKYGERVKNLRSEYLSELHALIGEKYLPRYQRLHRRRMKQMRSALRKSSMSFEDVVKLRKLRLANMEKSNNLIRRSGIDFSKVEALQKKYIKLESRAFSQMIGKEDMNQEPARRTRGNPSTVRLRPPFEYASMDTVGDKSDEPLEPWGEAYADRSYGDLLGQSLIRVIGADDSDHSHMLTFSSVGSSFVLPWDGSLLVWSRLKTYQVLCSWFEGSVARECGWSQDVSIFEDAKIRFMVLNLSTGNWEYKYIRLFKGITAPPPFHVTYPEDYADGFGSWDFNWFESGDELSTTSGVGGVLFEGPYHQGDVLFVMTTLYTVNRFWSNDFTVHSFLRHLYKLLETCISSYK